MPANDAPKLAAANPSSMTMTGTMVRRNCTINNNGQAITRMGKRRQLKSHPNPRREAAAKNMITPTSATMRPRIHRVYPTTTLTWCTRAARGGLTVIVIHLSPIFAGNEASSQRRLRASTNGPDSPEAPDSGGIRILEKVQEVEVVLSVRI